MSLFVELAKCGIEVRYNISAVPTLIYIGGNPSNEPNKGLNMELFADN